MGDASKTWFNFDNDFSHHLPAGEEVKTRRLFYIVERVVAPHGIEEGAVGGQFPVVVHGCHAHNEYGGDTQDEGQGIGAAQRHEDDKEQATGKGCRGI